MSTNLPPAGLQGDYTGACVVCFRGTDSGIRMVGEGEFLIAGVVNLGVPDDQAPNTVSAALGCDPGNVPDGTVVAVVRVCEACAKAAGVPRVGLLADEQSLPTFAQQ